MLAVDKNAAARPRSPEHQVRTSMTVLSKQRYARQLENSSVEASQVDPYVMAAAMRLMGPGQRIVVVDRETVKVVNAAVLIDGTPPA